MKPYILPSSTAAPKSDLERRHLATVRFGWRMKSKLTDNEKLAAAILDHCALYGVDLPDNRKDFKRERAAVLRLDEYGDQLADLLEPLAKLHYALRQTFGTYAEFGDGENKRLVPLTFFYSRHRLDYAWNLRKSQLVRQRYAEFLAGATDEAGRRLIDHYLPVHLTLTVPHQNGVFRGETFYARQLIECFAELRKTDTWKQVVYAGEYGLEVKRGKGNAHGLHIHTHSFLLQHPEYTVHQVRKRLEVEWKVITGNTSQYSGMAYETLYCKKKNAAGRMEKVYLEPGVSPLADYTAGVMECIKYHFKPDCLTKVGGGFDMDLIIQVLGNTQGLRMYSRFGAFYKQPALNFNRLHEATPVDELSTEALDEEVRASSDGVEERLVDPRTMTLAEPDSYRFKVGHPLALRYRGETSYYPREAYEPYLGRPEGSLMSVPPGLTLKQVIGLQVKGQLEKLCRYAETGLLTPGQLAEFLLAVAAERAGSAAPKSAKPPKPKPTRRA